MSGALPGLVSIFPDKPVPEGRRPAHSARLQSRKGQGIEPGNTRAQSLVETSAGGVAPSLQSQPPGNLLAFKY